MEPTNKRCPVCQENGRDNGTDGGHLFLMSKGDRWCCNRTDAHPDGAYVFFDNDPDTNEPIFEEEKRELDEPAEMTQEDTEEEVTETHTDASVGMQSNDSDIFTAPKKVTVVEDFRGVPKEMWEEYGVTFQKKGKELTHQIYPVTLKGKERTTKIRVIEDKEFFWSDSKKAKKKDLFGMLTIGDKIPKRLLITEGEIDAVSACYMLKKYKVKVVSGMDGASMKNIADNVHFLEKIPKLSICPDNDVAGNEWCERIVSMFPEITVVELPLKDANEMLVNGRGNEFLSAYFDAGQYKPPSIVQVSTIQDSLRDYVPMGISYPWPSLDAITYGIVPHQILSIGSGPGAGKSTVVRGIQEHLMFHHGLPIGIFSLEESKELTLRQLVGYQMNKRIHLPGSQYDVDEAIAHAERLEGKALIYDRRFFNGSWERIIKGIRFMYGMGVCHFCIDPISALVVHLDSSAQNTALGQIMSDLSALMQELPIYVMLVNHLNNPTSGPTHDEGGRVLPSQFTGSKSQWRFSTDMWGLERNILAEEDDEKNTMIVRNLKHRTDGSLTGRYIKLGYDLSSGRLVENQSGFTPGSSGLTLDKAPEAFASKAPAKEPAKQEKPSGTLNDFFGG